MSFRQCVKPRIYPKPANLCAVQTVCVAHAPMCALILSWTLKCQCHVISMCMLPIMLPSYQHYHVTNATRLQMIPCYQCYNVTMSLCYKCYHYYSDTHVIMLPLNCLGTHGFQDFEITIATKRYQSYTFMYL